MNDEQRAYHAKAVLDNPVFRELMARLEDEALERGINAKFNDHEARQAAMSDIRAVRSFRSACESMTRNKPEPKAAPA